MDIQGKTVLVIGGWGLVGSAVCRTFMEERPRVTCALLAVARRDGVVQQAFESASSCSSYRHMLGLEPAACEVSRRAAALLAATKPPGGPRTVILDPKLAGVFAHEAFGHLSEADLVAERRSSKKLLKYGGRVRRMPLWEYPAQG